MTEPVPHSPLRSYADELVATQRAAVRAGAAIAAVLVVGYSLLDRALVPDRWLPLLATRFLVAAILALVFRRMRRPAPHAIAAAQIVVCATAAAVAIAIFAESPARSPYLYGMMLVQAGLALLLPMLPWQAALLNAEVLAITFVPFALFPPSREERPALVAAASYLLTMALLGVAGSVLADRVRRREHQARAEFARHSGLLNLGTLAGGLAHELANPLNALGLEVELLARDPARDTEKRLGRLRTNVARMRNILEAMRNGARLSASERRSIDLVHEVDLAYTLLESRLRRAGSIVRAYAEVPPLFCQPTLLGQVLVNLLVNAADAVAGRPDGRIALRVHRKGHMAVVEVEDNGPGVPAALREKIFEPFFSTKGDQGNGLGLWISSEIARMHGGALSVDEAASGGAVFRLIIPIEARAADGHATPSPPGR